MNRAALIQTATIALCGALVAPVKVCAANLVVQAASSLEDDASPILYAQASGLFSRSGIDVELVPMTNGAASAAAVIGGSIGIAKVSLYALIAAHVRGIPLQIVAAGGEYLSSRPNAGFIVAANSRFRSAKDLDGAVLATGALKDLRMLAMQAWIDASGGDSRRVKFVEIPPASAYAAVVAGRVDGTMILDPTLAEALKSGTVRMIGRPADAIAPRYLVSAWIATPAYIANNLEAVRSFAKCVKTASAYVNDNGAAAATYLAPFLKQDVNELKQLRRTILFTSVKAAEIQPSIDLGVKYGVIPASFPASDLIAPVAIAMHTAPIPRRALPAIC